MKKSFEKWVYGIAERAAKSVYLTMESSKPKEKPQYLSMVDLMVRWDITSTDDILAYCNTHRASLTGAQYNLRHFFLFTKWELPDGAFLLQDVEAHERHLLQRSVRELIHKSIKEKEK